MTTAGSSASNKLSGRVPVAGCGPSGTVAASPAGGIVTERTSVTALSYAFSKEIGATGHPQCHLRCCCTPGRTSQ
eukprot:7729331-Pyramimonas_sp.AAC.1